MTEVFETGNFIRKVRSLMRVGEFSRGRLDVLRIEVTESEAECEWVARPTDVWDVDVPWHVRERNFAAQALQDGLKMREILFDTFERVKNAELRAYRRFDRDQPELVLTGTAYRDDDDPKLTISVAMRAKLLGFRFSLTDGMLMSLVSERSRTSVAFSSSPNTI
jgi:hypothetical protein